MQVKLIILFFCLFACNYSVAADVAFTIESEREMELLEHFFRKSFTEEEYGYVLEGIKPISVRNYYHPSQVPLVANYTHTETEIANSLLVFEAIPFLKKLNSNKKNFVLKIAHMNVLGSNDLGFEVQFINIPLLEKTIEENISLFKYILGATITTKDIVDRLAYSEETLSDVLLENHTLIGIVLGYGSLNSIFAGRKEDISFHMFSHDLPPYATKAANLSEGYAFHFFNAIVGQDHIMSFRTEFSPLLPMPGFTSIQDEIKAIDEHIEPIPLCLNENPRFQFGAFKESFSNQNFFNDLQKTQKKIQKLLHQKNFLEIILTKFSGKKPSIKCKKRNNRIFDLSFFKNFLGIEGWKKIIFEVSDQFSEDRRDQFFQTFLNPPVEMTFTISGHSEATLKGLEIALANLAETKNAFEDLSNDSSLIPIVSKQLYYKTIICGSGSDVSEYDKIRINYYITDLNGKILSANHNAWLSQSKLIPGFSHGLKGMRIGEKREIYIHPSYGYGVLTTVSPCMGLVVIVQLIDIDKKYHANLPALYPIDCEWIENTKLLEDIRKNIERKPIFAGWFYHHLMNKIEGNEAENIRNAFLH